MSKKLNKGLHAYQTEKATESQLSILSFLSDDEDWHQYSEIKGKTNLSHATLSKQLRQLKEMKLIVKNIDTKSGKYPYPVFYRLNPVFADAFRANLRNGKTRKLMKEKIRETKNPLEVLNEINKDNNLAMLGILVSFTENKIFDERIRRILLELLLWKPYRYLTWDLIEETEKILKPTEIRNLVWEL